MQRPVKGNPIQKEVSSIEILRKLYEEGKFKEIDLERMLHKGQLSAEQFFYITNDIEALEQ